MPRVDPPGARVWQVSDPPKWLVAFNDLLRHARVSTREIVCAGGRLRIVLSGEPPLVAMIRPRTPGVPGWAMTEGFVLGYDGVRDLDRAQQQQMTGVLEVLRRLGGSLPPALDAGLGVFAADVPAEERFAKLFPFTHVERSTLGEQQIVEVLLRITSRCNQLCPFCSAPAHAIPSAATVTRCIDSAAATFPHAMLNLTGGEPTLRPSFTTEVRRAVDHDAFSRVQVQTNAVAFARKLDPAVLPDSHRLFFFVSLHASDPVLYDRCTGTEGQFPLALTGIRRLLDSGHRITLNCVVSSANVDHIDQLVRDVAALFGSGPELHFSSLLCPECNPAAGDYLVPYARLAAQLEAATHIARELGMTVQSLRSSTYAAVPACMLGAAHRNDAPHRPEVDSSEVAVGTPTRAWVKAERCGECVESVWCRGVPRAYVERFGLAELRPIA